MSSIGLDVHRAPPAALGATAHRRGQCADRNSPCPCQRSPRGTAECPMTVTAVGSPVTAEAFVIASEPAPGLAAGCRTALRGGAEDRPEPAYLYSMRRWRPPMERCEYSAGRSPCECLGSPKLLTFRSGQGHASRGRLRREQIEPSAHSMPGSGSPARDAGPSEHGVRAGTPPRESAFPCQHGRRGSARGRIRRPVSREASHSPAIAKIIRSFGSPFGSLTTISSSEKQWAQQGSNLRPLACKTSYYGRWTWPGVASASNDCGWTWPGVAWCRWTLAPRLAPPFG
jgi:hypothetical protein